MSFLTIFPPITYKSDVFYVKLIHLSKIFMF